MITLLLAFPYTYIMVRTRSAFLRKFLLIALFLLFWTSSTRLWMADYSGKQG